MSCLCLNGTTLNSVTCLAQCPLEGERRENGYLKEKEDLKQKIRNEVMVSKIHSDEVATGAVYSLETGEEKVSMGLRHVSQWGRRESVYVYLCQFLLSEVSKEDYER